MPFWRRERSAGRRKHVGKHGLDFGERGIYDTRNKLNDLTGKEWIYFLNSVWITAYPPTAGKDTAFDLRKIHPSPKPPELMRDIVAFFTKGAGAILDPLAGVGGSLLGAAMCDPPRRGVGIELNPTYANAFQNIVQQTGAKNQTMITGDALLQLDRLSKTQSRFELVVTDPPYADMMSRKKNGQKLKLYGKNHASPFSNDSRDLGNLPYEVYLEELQKILAKACNLLRDKGHLVVFCKDFQPTPGRPNLLHADLISTLGSIQGMTYRGMRIWHDQATDLYPFGYPFAFVMNQMHHYILIFRKG